MLSCNKNKSLKSNFSQNHCWDKHEDESFLCLILGEQCSLKSPNRQNGSSVGIKQHTNQQNFLLMHHKKINKGVLFWPGMSRNQVDPILSRPMRIRIRQKILRITFWWVTPTKKKLDEESWHFFWGWKKSCLAKIHKVTRSTHEISYSRILQTNSKTKSCFILHLQLVCTQIQSNTFFFMR